MSSIITHLVTSNIIKEKYNFSDTFLLGSTFPDILKQYKNETRIETHYSVFYETEDKQLELPNIESFLYDNKYNMSNELKKGYLVHLIEDNIWFEKYINKYTKKANNKVIYLPTNTFLTEEEFSKQMHTDYSLLDRYILNKYNFDYMRINNYAHKKLKKYDKQIDELIKLYDTEKEELQIVLSYAEIEDYITDACKEIEKYLDRKDIKW